MDYLITQFGKINEPIDEDLLEDIQDELSTLKEHAFELSLASIELGKPKILEYLLEEYEFNPKEIRKMKKHVEEYVEHEESEGSSSEDIEEMAREFEDLISNSENPRKKKWNRR